MTRDEMVAAIGKAAPLVTEGERDRIAAALSSASPAPAPLDDETAVALPRLDAMLATMIAEVTARRDMAARDRAATDESEQGGVTAARAMTGRAGKARTAAERRQSADRHDRIADRIEADGNALMSAIAALRYAPPAPAGDGSLTPEQQRTCVVCRQHYPLTGQQAGIAFWLTVAGRPICKRCVEAGRDAARALTAAPGDAAPPDLAVLTPACQAAAHRFRTMFREVPLSDVEKLPEPDYEAPETPAPVAHDWRPDGSRYRCHRCLVASDAAHGPTCLAPPAAPLSPPETASRRPRWTIETREVLAACYTRNPVTMLSHAVVVEDGRERAVLCKRVRVDCIADGGAGGAGSTSLQPTCPRCLAALTPAGDTEA